MVALANDAKTATEFGIRIERGIAELCLTGAKRPNNFALGVIAEVSTAATILIVDMSAGNAREAFRQCVEARGPRCRWCLGRLTRSREGDSDPYDKRTQVLEDAWGPQNAIPFNCRRSS